MTIPAIHLAAAAIDSYRRTSPNAAVDMRDAATVEHENREIARIVCRTIAANVSMGMGFAADEKVAARDAIKAALDKAVAESL